MEKKQSVAANALTYGLIAGAVIIVYSLVLYIANIYLNKGVSSISYLFLLAGMVWGCLLYTSDAADE